MQHAAPDTARHDGMRSPLPAGTPYTAHDRAHDRPNGGTAPDLAPDDAAADDTLAALLDAPGGVQSPERTLHLDIMRTAAALGDALERAIRPRGLTGAQYNVLRILRDADPRGLCRNALRECLPTRMPDVTRLLDRLEGAGYVTRQRDPQDRRLVTTCITPAGRRVADELDAAVLEEHRRRLGVLEPAQAQALGELLALVRAGVETVAPRVRR
jgi:DNA-binding MarR family transcriptional regulator